MYIITKLESVAMPATNLQIANAVTFVANIVAPLPIIAIKFEIINTGNRPILSAQTPNNNDPITDPMKNNDCPNDDFHADSHTQSS